MSLWAIAVGLSVCICSTARHTPARMSRVVQSNSQWNKKTRKQAPSCHYYRGKYWSLRRFACALRGRRDAPLDLVNFHPARKISINKKDDCLMKVRQKNKQTSYTGKRAMTSRALGCNTLGTTALSTIVMMLGWLNSRYRSISLWARPSLKEKINGQRQQNVRYFILV